MLACSPVVGDLWQVCTAAAEGCCADSQPGRFMQSKHRGGLYIAVCHKQLLQQLEVLVRCLQLQQVCTAFALHYIVEVCIAF